MTSRFSFYFFILGYLKKKFNKRTYNSRKITNFTHKFVTTYQKNTPTYEDKTCFACFRLHTIMHKRHGPEIR